MTALSTMHRPAAASDHVVQAETAETLTAILLPDINLAIWARAAPAVGDFHAVDDLRFIVQARGAVEPLQAAMIAAGYCAATAGPLAIDIAALAARLGDLLDRERVTIRLEVIETDACKRFHADFVGVRLICTYAGPGTQWLAQEDAARLSDGVAVGTLAIHAITTGHVALFKGREWAPERPIIHRSPPIAGTSQRRLVLVIDGVADA